MSGKPSKDLVKVIVSLVLIASAVFVIIRFGLRKGSGKPPEETPYICSACGRLFTVPTGDVNRLVEENPSKDGRIKCPACSKFTGERAIICAFCGEPYLISQSQEKYGVKYRCPHCGKSLADVGTEQPEKEGD